ncbi:MAG: hypothetical protein LKI60_01850 [Bifidobacterium tibiigranuli]|jgi:MFS family permease|nr:hypothetical protein [Bifidobacterium tibiigranuli]
MLMPRRFIGLSLTIFTLADLSIFGLTTAPTPLYGRYQAIYHLGTFGVTVLFAAFAFGSALTLGILGTDLVNCKFTSLLAASYILAMLAIPCLQNEHSLTVFLLGRLLSGVAVGLVASGFTPFAQRLIAPLPSSSHDRHVWSSVIPSLTMLGLGSGPILGVLCIQQGFTDSAIYYSIYGFAPLFALVFQLLHRRKIQSILDLNNGTSSRKYDLNSKQRGPVPGLFLLLFVAFSISGIYGALSPHIVNNLLCVAAPTQAGLIAGITFISGAIIPMLPFPPLTRQRNLTLPRDFVITISLMLFATLTCLVAATTVKSMSLFIASAALGGGTAGLLFSHALTAILKCRPKTTIIALCAQAYCCAYLGLIIPILLCGALIDRFSLPIALIIFTSMVTLLFILGITATKLQLVQAINRSSRQDDHPYIAG